MKLKILLLSLIIGECCFGAGNVFAKEYYYKNFEADIKINEDSSFDVTEKQTYFLDGKVDSFRREIDLNNRSYLSQIEALDGMGNEIPEEDLFINQLYNSYIVYWMFPEQNQNFSNEEKSWIIKYKVHRGLDFLEDYDQICWKLYLIDSDLLSSRVDNIKITIYFANGEKFRSDLAKFDFNNISDKSENGYYFENDNRKIIFWAKNLEPATYHSIPQFMPLLPNSEPKLESDSSFVAFVGWQKGIVEESFDYTGKMVIALVFLLAFLIIFVSLLNNIKTYLKEKKDLGNKRKPIIVRSLPDHLKPAEAGILTDSNGIEKCLVATIIDLAIRGYLIIREKKGLSGKKKYQFEKLKDEADLSLYEKDIMETVFKKHIFSSGWIEQLRFGSSKFTKLIYKPLIKNSYVRKNVLSIWNHFAANGRDLVILLFVVWMGMIMISGIGNLFLSTDMLNIWENKLNIVVDTGIGHFISTMSIYLAIISFSVVISIAIAIVFSFIFKISSSQFLTKNGIEGRWKWLGFLEYLKTAREFRELNKKDMTIEIFLKYLPYAVALGAEEEWANKFADIPCKKLSWFIPLKENTGNHKKSLPFSVLSDDLLSFISSSINLLTYNRQ